MNDSRLTEILQSLPRERASGDFTARVRSRVEPRPVFGLDPASWPTAAAVAALVVLAVGFGWREWRHSQARAAEVARLEMLLSEKQALEAELLTLRRLASEARPVVYLGGNEEVDLVLDLARFQRRQTARRPAPPTPNTVERADLRIDPRGARPAVY